MLDPNIAVDDHAYFTLTNENTTIAKNCLDEETLNTTNELCDYINTDHAYIQSDCKNTSIADYSLDNELGTSDDIEYDPVEEQCIDIECTTTVHVHVDPFTELKKVLELVDIAHAIQIVKIFKLFNFTAENVSVKLNITINSDYSAKIYIHRIEL